jgi:hypothetical protein
MNDLINELVWGTGGMIFGEKLSQCHFVHHKSQVDFSGVEPAFRDYRPAPDIVIHGTTLGSAET